MKRFFMFLPIACLAVASCGSGDGFSSGDYDPLNAAGRGSGTRSAASGMSYRPGEFVQAAMNNTAFFKQRPKGEATADRLLSMGTTLKVVKDDGSYLKVELDNGETGFVPAVQVIGGNNAADVPQGNEVQVWPPIGGETLPPPGAVETSQVPTIPFTMDPEAPAPDVPPLPEDASTTAELPDVPLPDDAPTPGLGSEPMLPDDAPTPGLGAEPAQPKEPESPKDESKEESKEEPKKGAE